ncbi:Alpha/Beta hydrolase protein [Protomyces lactucae-debilis]|uniref:Carboxypeptidase n=1 Tax=Protomyces lactucae-debilis TaxID=2754530 RepID=A0A1Y2FI70_PROLT|nr:Alpha/Beta hydrolase protein [Protomyces lactucae-debilis]ORY83074.1 Alpha/Beta hydrolase protein [Protomyces lactucae-debilis]
MRLQACVLLLAHLSRTLANVTSDYYISSLPGLNWPSENNLKMHAGHIELSAEFHGNMFFWHVANKHIADRRRTVIWLNGGPGCSSMDGLFLEVGPFQFSEDGQTLVERKGSWHESANLLFVDNPLGTGFSYIDTDAYLTELDQMAGQFLLFLDKFIDLFPEYEQDDLYIAGESYAGQFIPYIAQAMLKRNENATERQRNNLQGIMIGNGWIDPMTGYDSYLPFALATKLIEEKSPQHDAVQEHLDQCHEAAKTQGYGVNLFQCESILNKVLEVTLKKDDAGANVCINSYDIRKTDTYPSCGMNWPSELTHMTPYLQRPDVVHAIHADSLKKGWIECNGAVSSTFRARKSRPSAELFPQLVKQIQVLLYSGEQDLICNHIGTETWLAKLDWNGYTGFDDGEHQEWDFRGQDTGYYKSSRNLTYVLFKDASHMVPYDKSLESLDMLNRFLGVPAEYLDNPGTVGSKAKSRPVSAPVAESPTVEGPPAKEEAQTEDAAKAKAARFKAYYKAGGGALVVIILLAGGLGYYVWRSRKNKGFLGRRKGSGHAAARSDADETELQALVGESCTSRMTLTARHLSPSLIARWEILMRWRPVLPLVGMMTVTMIFNGTVRIVTRAAAIRDRVVPCNVPIVAIFNFCAI